MKINRSLLVSSILLTVILILPCSGATGLCNGVSYDKDIYRCEYGELIGKCKGKDYYVAYDKCVNGVVVSGTASSNNSSTFTDSRDGKVYKLVKIGTQVWMAENLNYNASGSKCYDNNPANCQIYGRLYNWTTAKKACPAGWHLPSDKDWNVLMKFVNPSCSNNSACAYAGTKLKSTSGWNSKNGTDDYGFVALPGGLGGSDGSFYHVGNRGDWWGSSESGADGAYYRTMYGFNEYVYYGDSYKSGLYSVRCVQN